MIVGFIYLEDLFARGQLHKTIFSIMALLAFGGIVIVHYWRGLRGRIAVYLTLLASSFAHPRLLRQPLCARYHYFLIDRNVF